MRQEIVDYIATLGLGGYLLTDEIPWSADNTPLFLRNLKKIYVDETATASEPIIRALNGLNVNNEQQVTRIYFANDAKQIPPNYSDVITSLKTCKDITTISGIQSRSVEVSTSFEDDVLVTEITVTFTRLN